MKSPAKDIVLIAVALFVILGCGIGIGNRFAPKIDPSPTEVVEEDFTEVTLELLRKELELSDEQVAEILPEIEGTTADIAKIRREARFKYRIMLLELHDKLIPKVAPEQQEKLRKERDRLQKIIELRFPKLLEEYDSTAGGGSNRD